MTFSARSSLPSAKTSWLWRIGAGEIVNACTACCKLGYFKAKHAFFGLTTDMVPTEDISFVAERYFPDIVVPLRPLRPSELYVQRAGIAWVFGFRLWSKTDRPALVEAATELARRDVTPNFVGLELLGILKDRKIVRPG